jgi:dolichol-phosphate mannosyltransferase
MIEDSSELERRAMDEAGPELCIIVPTFNERGSILPLVQELCGALGNIAWEVIVVDDDSSDGTARAVRELGVHRSRVRCLQRIGRRGLSTACIEGMLASSASYLAVMDGDLQHDPKILPIMLDLVKNTDCEVAVGSRYVEGGSTANWSSSRLLISRIATRLGYRLIPPDLRDPMSGFFMLRRQFFEEVVHGLSGLGFKILLDILASAHRRVNIREVPFVFRARQAGESKLDSQVAWEYLMLLGDKMVGRFVPIRFLAFAAVGTVGILFHLLIVTFLFRLAGTSFVEAQGVGTVLTMGWNYTLNNLLTYRDRRRRGLNWIIGLVSFLAVCSIGAVANIGVASYLFERQSRWTIAAIGGVLVGAVWNFAVSGAYTWGTPRRSN